MLQFGWSKPLLCQALAAAVVRHVFGFIALKRDSEAGHAVADRIEMLSGRDCHTGHCQHIVDKLAVDRGLFAALNGEAGKIP